LTVRRNNNGLPRGESEGVANWLVVSVIQNEVGSCGKDVGRHASDWDEVGYPETAIYKVTQLGLHSIANTKPIVSLL
jgi:hypothetical protein